MVKSVSTPSFLPSSSLVCVLLQISALFLPPKQGVCGSYQSSLSSSSSTQTLQCPFIAWRQTWRRKTLTTLADFFFSFLERCSQCVCHARRTTSGDASWGQPTAVRTSVTSSADLGRASVADLTPIYFLETGNTACVADRVQHCSSTRFG